MASENEIREVQLVASYEENGEYSFQIVSREAGDKDEWSSHVVGKLVSRENVQSSARANASRQIRTSDDG